jgi:hypothetical protein
MKIFRWIAGLALFVCLLPYFCMLAAEVYGRMVGCEVGVDTVKPCIVNGADIGHDLTVLGAMGYFAFVTTPIILGIVIVWVLVELIRWANKSRPAAP